MLADLGGGVVNRIRKNANCAFLPHFGPQWLISGTLLALLGCLVPHWLIHGTDEALLPCLIPKGMREDTGLTG